MTPTATASGTPFTVSSRSAGVGSSVARISRYWPRITTCDFATDSAVIQPAEETKLEASLAKIAEVVKRGEKFMKMTLYVAGHTDTVGTNAKNRKLSLDRARAIAKYFRKKKLTMPIAFAGFGEEVLKVKTADSTDEAGNRRADYVIGPASGAPPFKGPYLKVKAGWQLLR